jgi:hypothetical protein
MISLANVGARQHAVSIANTVLADLAIIQERLTGYFHVSAGNPVTDAELGAAGLLCVLAERLELAARTLKGSRDDAPSAERKTKEKPENKATAAPEDGMGAGVMLFDPNARRNN